MQIKREIVLSERECYSLLRVPVVFLAGSLVRPSILLANAVVWGCIVPWTMMGILAKFNRR